GRDPMPPPAVSRLNPTSYTAPELATVELKKPPDPDRGIHGLLVISEPDFWMVNLLTKTARHGVDPGPTFNCRMPIFPEATGSDLEFGMELQYFKNKGATPAEGPVLQIK